MVVISEWLPNPAGNDAKGEWVEVLNIGNSPVDLTGWRLTADGKKLFTLHGTLGPGAYLVVPRTESKRTLKNSDGRLALYDATGRLADQTYFIGTAPKGQSVNRTKSGIVFATPTPWAANKLSQATPFAYDNEYPIGAPLNPPTGAGAQIFGHLLGTALALAVAIVFILKSHADLSHIFFKRN